MGLLLFYYIAERQDLIYLTQQKQPIEPVEVETSFYPVFVGSPNH